VLDCDLAGFGLPFPEFVARQDRVLVEFAGANAELHVLRPKAAKFLQQFIVPERAHIYHTAAAQKAWESQAMDNIKAYCSRWLNATLS
jgi:predicted metal-dependent HD superfamily phosphohydrolase